MQRKEDAVGLFEKVLYLCLLLIDIVAHWKFSIRDQSLFMVVGGGGGGVAPKRNWLGRQNITQDQSWVGKNI